MSFYSHAHKSGLTALLVFFISSLPAQAQDAYPFREKDKWFIVDSAFKKVSKRSYAYIVPIGGRRFIVKNKKGLYGVADEKSNTLIPIKYEKIDLYENNYIGTKSGKQYMFNAFGKPIPFKMQFACGGTLDFISAINTYEKNGKTGICRYLYDARRMDTLPAVYDVVYEFSTRMAFAKRGNKWGMINDNGDVIRDFIFDSVQINEHCYNGFAHCISIYTIGKLKGYVNHKGELLTAAKYPDARFYSGNYALVQDRSRRWGYIDLKGKEYFK